MRNERTMPAWVTEQSDRVGPKPPPPPLATENGHITAPAKQPALPPKTSAQPEPDYEVIEFSNQQYSNTPMRPSSASSGSKTPDTKLKCTLCGSSNPWVMCEECSKQIFCASCDDMFHKHPKRKNHQRKTLEQSNPPLPPKLLPGQPGPAPPVAPPRRNKRGLMTPLMQRKDQVNSAALPIPPSPTPSMKNASWHERVGSLKRGLSILNRPLPETPKTPTTPSESSRCTTPKSVFDNIQRPPSVVLEKIKNKANATLDRMQMLQQRYRQQKEQMERDRNGYSSEQQRQLALQHHKLAAQRANQLGQRGMSSSVFNLNQASRKPPSMNNGWSNNPMHQAQSMAQLNCANCSHPQQGNWGHQHHMPMNHHDPWSNQLSSQQHLNRSNLSLNVSAGYMMPPQHSGMYPPPVFMNQRGMMGQTFAQPYMPGMPVMNPGLVGMPPSASRAASRAGSRMASPALSRKSVTLRRKQRASYHNDEATDDEDSDEDDRRSMVSNRSAMSRTRQRRMSSASQIQLEEDLDSGQQRSRVRSQRRDSVAKSVHNDWAPGRKISSSNNRSGDSGFNSPRQKPTAANRIYSDLDSEGSGTRALVQAKIEQKLKEESLKQQKQSKSKRRSESPPKQKQSMAVQTPVGHAKKNEDKPPEKPASESESEEEEEVEEEEEEEEQEEDQAEEQQQTNDSKTTTADESQKPQQNGQVNGVEPDPVLEDEDAESLGPPPSTPEQEWECEFCTFVNEPNIKICTICCKTPSKPPKLVAKSISPPKQVPAVKTTKDSKSESVEDIWAALDENIQATANEVTRKAETASTTSVSATSAKKATTKVSTGCGTTTTRDKSASIERQVEETRKSQAREIGTSPPPQTISTQTYETLPLRKIADKEESPSIKPLQTNGIQEPIQESDLLKYSSEELNAALKYCGPDMHPLIWLRDNWPKLIQTVQSLATKYGQERAENTIGTISQMEAREALRLHTGNIWQAVSECIEQRQRKYREISSKGNFSREDVVTALTTHQGNVEMALMDLGRNQLKPFLMRIWGSPGGVENESGSMIIPPSSHSNDSYSMDKENQIPEIPAETVLASSLKEESSAAEESTQSESLTTIKTESMPMALANTLESENSLPELPTEIVLAPVTEMLPPQTENTIPELPAEAVLPQEQTLTHTSSSMKVINTATNDTSLASVSASSPSPSSLSKDHELPSSSGSTTSPKVSKQDSVEVDDTKPSTSKASTAKPKATANKKKEDAKANTKKPATASKIPKPNNSQRDQKSKANTEATKETTNKSKDLPKDPPKTTTGTLKSKTEPKMILPTRSKSFSGPPTPIVLTSVKTITQRFQTVQKSQNNKPQLQKAPTTIARKPSITEAINRLTKPTSSNNSSELPSTSSLFRTRTTPRIPKKKYHETCFSDDDYESTSTEEEPEPIEIRQRKMSVPVFRAYPSVQEPEEVNTEELVDKFVKEELVNTIAEAQIAAALISMKFQQDVSLWAAKECSDLEHAIALLKQDCELCSGTYALNEIVSMLKCTHKCCKQCAKTYFTVQITERSINDCNCPFCKIPELHNQSEHEDDNLEYFSNLDIFLKNIVEPEVHELFQRKLRDRTLLKDPNFKWCVQCSSGFFARPKQKRLICPDCGSVTCASCRKTWQKQHEGISCEKFLEWEMANDPAVQALGVKEHLDQNGIDCPKCKFRYSLARGGCMHFTCTQCKYEFCYGCAKPFMMGAKCTISPYCAKLGLHAHHPRNCLFYLRDKLPVQLQILLKNNGVSFEVDPIETQDDGNVPGSSQKQAPLCPIPIQKETPNGLVDTKCNSDVPDKHAGMCRTHYVEYLTAKVAKAKIDPLPIFDLTDCVQELRRRGIPLPERGPWDTDEIYKNMCAEVIQKNIPLETN
uniref:IBR domain protein n=1 Tax=Musca domestica TaxID=7370 RepID=T1PN93_MUSDO